MIDPRLGRKAGSRRAALSGVLLASVLATALSATLTGCAERVVAGDPMPAYTLQEVVYAANDRDLRVVLHGQPFSGGAEALARAVLPSMQNRIMGVRTTLTTTPNDSARPDYRVVLVFNATGNLPSWGVCRDDAVPTLPPTTPPPDGTLVVQGAFCRGGGALTTATGWLDNPKGLDDPGLRQLIGDMTVSLFPNRRTDRVCFLRADC